MSHVSVIIGYNKSYLRPKGILIIRVIHDSQRKLLPLYIYININSDFLGVGVFGGVSMLYNMYYIICTIQKWLYCIVRQNKLCFIILGTSHFW